MLHSPIMPTNQDIFRKIPFDQYQRAHDDTDCRVTMGDIESGLIVEAFTTNNFLRKKLDEAITFTAELELSFVDRSVKDNLGFISIRFHVITATGLKRLPDIDRGAIVYPEPGIDGLATEWMIMDEWPLISREWNKKLKTGFFTH